MNKDIELFRHALQRQNERAARMQIPDDMEQRVMERIRSKNSIRRWLYLTSIAAVAAGVLLLLSLHYNNSNVKSTEALMVTRQTQPRDNTMKVEEKVFIANVQTVQSKDMERTNPKYRQKKSSAKPPITPEIPDTLGDGIWKQKENVMMALQMLAECEAVGKQIHRNTIVEAAFQSTLKPHHLQLVVSENGDYMVVDGSLPTIIEL